MTRAIYITIILFLTLNSFCANNERMSITHLTIRDGLLDSHVHKISQDSTGIIWFKTANGISRYNGYNILNDIQTDFPKRVTSLSPKNITGLVKKSPYIYKCNGTKVSAVVKHFNDTLIATFGDGIYTLKRNSGKVSFEDYHGLRKKLNSFFNNSVYDLFVDKSGSLWIATGGNGVYKIDIEINRFKHFNSRLKSPLSNYINALYELDNKTVLAGSSGKGMFSISEGNNFLKQEVSKFITSTGKITDYIDAILKIDNQLIIGSRFTGLYSLNISKNTPLSDSKYKSIDPKVGTINMIIKLNNDTVLLGTDTKTFAYNVKTEALSVFSDLPSFTILKDRKDNIWTSHNETGIAKNGVIIDSATLAHDVFEDSENNIWVGNTKGLGKYIKESNTFEYFLPEKNSKMQITTIDEDSKGNLWLSTRDGIFKFDKKRELFYEYRVNDNIDDNCFNPGTSIKTKNGDIVIGCNNGVFRFTPDSIINKTAPIPYITKYDIDEDKATFTVSSSSYYFNENNIYAYKLKDKSDWRYNNFKNNKIEFNNLKSGKYTFVLSVSNNDGVWSEQNVEYNFTIKKQNSYSLVTILILITSLLTLIYIKRLRKKRRDEEEAIINQTTELTEAIKEEVNSEQESVFLVSSREFVVENLSNSNFTVNELYAAMSMSKSQFYRTLKNEVDLSPNEFIRNIRLDKSCEFLKSGKYSINEVAYLVGFNSPSYFTRCFKNKFGISPSEYLQ